MNKMEIEINDMSKNDILISDTNHIIIDTIETAIDICENKKIKKKNPDKILATTKIGGLFPTTSNSRKAQHGRIKKHKTIITALKKYKKDKRQEDNQPIDKYGRFAFDVSQSTKQLSTIADSLTASPVSPVSDRFFPQIPSQRIRGKINNPAYCVA